MGRKIRLVCCNCNHEQVERSNRDGVSCEKCGGPTLASGWLDLGMDRACKIAIKPPPPQGAPEMDMITLNSLRLNYLEELRQIGMINASTQLEINARIKATCNAIERGLGIVKRGAEAVSSQEETR